MISDASRAIEEVSERDRRQRELKYARRHKMRYIDQLLNELEILNLAEQRTMPGNLSTAVVEVIDDSELEVASKPDSVLEAMDLLYEIQDSLMYNQIEDE
jgi:hypothetical protein